MRKRSLSMAMLLIVAMVGCARHKPAPSAVAPTVEQDAAAPAAQTPILELSKPTFRLKQTAGPGAPALPGSPFTVMVDNCTGDAPLEREQREMYVLKPRYVMDTSVVCVPLGAQTVEAARRYVAETYGIAPDQERRIEGVVSLMAPARARVEYTLRWSELGENNYLEILDGEVLVASYPVSVVTSAALAIVSSAPGACGSAAGQTVSVPLVVEKSAAGAASAGEEETGFPAPGSDAALNLAKAYLDALDQRQLERAYEMLHDDYRAAVPWAAYQRGYAHLIHVQVHSIEVVQVGKHHEQAEALLTLETEIGGAKRYSDWRALYDVVVTRGKPPYQRSISDVRMQRLDAG
ncbi:MAG: hypothetical protein V1772_12050 [Chloroflexota bacterium]